MNRVLFSFVVPAAIIPIDPMVGIAATLIISLLGIVYVSRL